MKPKSTRRFFSLVATAGVFSTACIYAQTVAIDPISEIPETHSLVKAWDFATDGDNEGWAGNGITSISIAGGVLSGTISNGDPQLGLANFTALPLGYSTIIEYRVSINPQAATPTGGSMFWSDYGGGVAGPKQRSVTIPEDSNYHVVRITFPGGVKNLSGLRLDPSGGGFPKLVSFDYIKVYHYQPTEFTNVTLTASDALNTSSLASAGLWDSGAAPTTTSNYFTGAFQLRTPQNTTTYYPFGGSSLTVNSSGSLLFKGTGGALVRQINLAGGSLLHGDTGVASPNNIAKIFVPDGIAVTAPSTLGTEAVNRTIEITGSFSGTEALSVTGGGTVVLKSDNTGYSGNLSIATNSFLDLDHDSAVAGANVSVGSGGQVRRIGSDADGATPAASWSITGRGPASETRGAIYYNKDTLSGSLAGPISISGAQSRIGMYSAGGTLTLSGAVTGSGGLELWGGGGAEGHVQRFILNGEMTHEGQTDLLADFGSQTHLRLGGANRLPTNQRLRMSASWGGSVDGAGAFFDLNGNNQTLSSILLEGSKRKILQNALAGSTSTLTLTAATNAFDTNGGGAISIQGLTITHLAAIADSGAMIDGGSTVTMTNSTWNAPFYTTLGNSGSGVLVLNNSTFSFGGEVLMARGNNNGTLTVDANSLVTTLNFLRIGDSATGVATVNLNGGTIAAKRFHNSSTGTGILNLNGGTLRATGSNLEWIEGGVNGVTVNILSGGIQIDSSGHDIHAKAPLLASESSPGGGLLKKGAGSLTLSDNSTYTGVTEIQAGSLVVDGDLSLATGSVTVAANSNLQGVGTLGGSITVNGVVSPGNSETAIESLMAPSATFEEGSSLVVDLDDQSLLKNDTLALTGGLVINGGSLELNITGELAQEVYTLVTYSGAAPTGTLTAAAVPEGYSLDFAHNGNSVALVKDDAPPADPYVAWLAAYPTMTGADAAPEADFDHDGIANGIEFLTGSLPNDAGSSTYPLVTRDESGNLVVTFSRAEAAKAYTVTVESSTTLQAPWTPTSIPAEEITGPPVTVVDHAENADTVTVVVPAEGATKLFARVKVEIPYTP